jgi:hypothetical protein
MPSGSSFTSSKCVAVENVTIFAGLSITQTVVSLLSPSVRFSRRPIARASFLRCTVSSSRAVCGRSITSAIIGYHGPPGA